MHVRFKEGVLLNPLTICGCLLDSFTNKTRFPNIASIENRLNTHLEAILPMWHVGADISDKSTNSRKKST
jgi:hypothetical protein